MLSKQNLQHMLAVNPSMLFVSGSTSATRNSNNQFAVELVERFAEGTVIIDVLKDQDLLAQLLEISPWKILPQLFVGGEFVGGAFVMEEYFNSGEHRRRAGWCGAEASCRSVTKRPLSAYWRMSVQGDSLLAAGADGCLHFLDPASGGRQKSIKMAEGWVNCVASTRDVILTGDTDGRVLSINFHNLDDRTELASVGAWVNDIFVSEGDGGAGFIDGKGDVYRKRKAESQFSRVMSTNAIGWSICYNEQDGNIIAGLNDGRVVVVDMNGRAVYSARLYSGPVTSIICSGDEYYMCGFGPYISILNLREKKLEQFTVHRDRIWDVKKMGDQIVTVSGDGTAAYFNLAQRRLTASVDTRKLPNIISPKSSREMSVIFHIDGSASQLRTA